MVQDKILIQADLRLCCAKWFYCCRFFASKSANCSQLSLSVELVSTYFASAHSSRYFDPFLTPSPTLPYLQLLILTLAGLTAAALFATFYVFSSSQNWLFLFRVLIQLCLISCFFAGMFPHLFSCSTFGVSTSSNTHWSTLIILYNSTVRTI